MAICTLIALHDHRIGDALASAVTFVCATMLTIAAWTTTVVQSPLSGANRLPVKGGPWSVPFG